MNNLSHYVKIFDNAFDKNFCDKLIKTFETLEVNNSPTMRMSNYSWDKDYRRFLEVNIKQDSAFTDLINPYYSIIYQVYNQYKSIVNSDFFPSKYALEDGRMKKYNNDDYDQFGWHTDVGDKASASRYLAMFVYLNDVDEGGETQFMSNLDFTIKPKCGTIVVFPPMWMYEHRGKKPISNAKYILSTYLHYV
jgi:hypothetical protein